MYSTRATGSKYDKNTNNKIGTLNLFFNFFYSLQSTLFLTIICGKKIGRVLISTTKSNSKNNIRYYNCNDNNKRAQETNQQKPISYTCMKKNANL